MLRRRQIRAAVLASVALALLLPSLAAAASPYQAIVVEQACTTSGGAHGRGYVLLRVKAREVGMSGTNYFVLRSELQWSSGLAYSTRKTYPAVTSSNFPDNGTNYYRILQRRYDFKPSDEVSHRLVITVRFRSNTDGLLATRIVRGRGC